jgi:hypothetical protein
VADAVARAAQKTETADGAAADDGFLSKTWRKISDGVSDAVTVRPEGEVEGDGPLERLARAEARLAEFKLAAAVAELDGLSGAPRDAATAWLDQAKSRLAADKAIEEIQALALGQLAAPRRRRRRLTASPMRRAFFSDPPQAAVRRSGCSDQPGAVTLHWFDHRIDTSMGVLAALLFLLVAVAIFLAGSGARWSARPATARAIVASGDG